MDILTRRYPRPQSPLFWILYFPFTLSPDPIAPLFRKRWPPCISLPPLPLETTQRPPFSLMPRWLLLLFIVCFLFCASPLLPFFSYDFSRDFRVFFFLIVDPYFFPRPLFKHFPTLLHQSTPSKQPDASLSLSTFLPFLRCSFPLFGCFAEGPFCISYASRTPPLRFFTFSSCTPSFTANPTLLPIAFTPSPPPQEPGVTSLLFFPSVS